ncbi:DUF2806 domain-containing protein [Desulfatirhabdium butyrativorans]|uniref:DUF2806 domain-containing protein n=1 Tax=Desulfatirhabdium butyrativorans TaxID=340467 RepID=UPI0004189E8F|nr:DUF2806 domain-containing protein [Desulfatirhabdium butyrativorans]
MPDNNALINLGDLSKPATVLIEKVCNAVGVLYEPTRIRRQARAEVDAEKIKALARVELTSLQERAIERLVHQEERKQQNIEDITAQAAAQLGANARAEELDEDWVAHFFKQCETVSDKEMQSLWAKLLAGEATKPSTFSKRTIDFVASIDKRDAALFTTLGQFVWSLGDPTPMIFDPNSDLLKKVGLSFTNLKHLDAIGLISFESVAGYRAQQLSKHAVLLYFDRPVLLEFQQEANNNLDLGKALLTSIGQQLFSICGAEWNEEYFRSVLKQWRALGIKVTTPGYAEPEA